MKKQLFLIAAISAFAINSLTLTKESTETFLKKGTNMSQKIILELPEIKLVGITARTSNAAEMDPTTAQIGTTLGNYFYGDVPNAIPHRKNAGKTFCIYTEYETDFNGAYTYFVGEEVTSFDGVPENLITLTIPAQQYVRFTTESGAMPDICIQEWIKIWKLSAAELGGERSYIADFELYDERAADPQNTALDIFIGIKK